MRPRVNIACVQLLWLSCRHCGFLGDFVDQCCPDLSGASATTPVERAIRIGGCALFFDVHSVGSEFCGTAGITQMPDGDEVMTCVAR